MWMFGSRTTVKKVRNSLTWFSQRGEGDEGLKVEEGFSFGRLQGGFKGASRASKGGFTLKGFKGA